MKIKKIEKILINIKDELKKMENEKKVIDRENKIFIKLKEIIEEYYPKHLEELDNIFSLLEQKKFSEVFDKIKNILILNQEVNIILQAYSIFSLIIELRKNNFLNSDYYKSLPLNPSIKNLLEQTQIDNQGSLLIGLYVYLLLPKEIFNFYDFKEIDNFIHENKLPNSNIKSEDDSYIRHIRNSIGHGSVKFFENEKIVFIDKNPKTNIYFNIEFPLNKIGLLLNKLQETFLSIIKKIYDLKY